jgi:NADPH2 dehydrogenase
MASETADADGLATPATLERYAERAQAGAGIVMVEYSFVSRSGRSEPNQLGANLDSGIPGLASIARSIHASGALAILQLTHSGGKTERQYTEGDLLGPSEVAVPHREGFHEPPRAMTLEEIASLKLAFVQAAGRARAAGFDGIELHSAHGYGLNQWLSAYTNRRTDAYGGTLQKRLRLLLEILREIGATEPGLLRSVRIPGQDFVEGGLSLEDMKFVARALAAEGVDLINVSSGLGGWRRPRDRQGEGYLVAEAREIQKAISAPVIGVGGIESGEYIDARLRDGSFSLAAVGRAILANPREWNLKIMKG